MTANAKAIIKNALAELFGKKDPSALDRYWAAPYPQHNPRIPDGVAPLRPMVAQTTSFETRRWIAEREFVVTHSVAHGWGPAPMVVFDVFLVRGGKIVEHWDVMQPVAERTVSGRTQIDGPTEIVDLDQTVANKAIVRGFFDSVIYGHEMDELPTYVSTSQYAQHNPGVGDGLAGFGKAMAELAQAGLTMEYRKTYRMIAEGNFVFAHSEGVFAGRHVAFADLFRLEHGKIVEHWDCIQDVVPAHEAANKNGMFEQVTP